MKNILLAILLVCSTGALGQSYGSLSSQPQIFEFPDHPGHAQPKAMAKEQNLYGEESPYTYAHGELPLSDFPRASASVPLGDVARNLKQEHLSAKKANIVWAN